MPRIQIYLPDDLYEAVKSRGLPISELSQDAVRASLRRELLRAETESYIEELAARIGGPPSAKELESADRWIEKAGSARRRRAS